LPDLFEFGKLPAKEKGKGNNPGFFPVQRSENYGKEANSSRYRPEIL
jgi:hypothetical protein